MRIVAGQYKGMIIPLPKGGTIRPTTDRAKEALFSILTSRINFENTSVCDLFSGSGNMAFEFASRGVESVIAVEKNRRVLDQAKTFAINKNINEVTFISSDAFRYLNQSDNQFDIIFADPPYNLKTISEIPNIVKRNNLLKPEGLLIIEHESNLSWNDEALIESRNYGQSVFSIFQFPVSLEK